MTENAGIIRTKLPAVTLRLGAMLAVALLATMAVLAVAIGPYLFKSDTLYRDVVAQLRTTTGLELSSNDAASFRLLPSPHVKISNLHIADTGGTLTIDADALSGSVRLLPLIVGRLELASAALQKPRLTIDLDGRPIAADSTIGRVMRAEADYGEGRRLGVVTLEDGSAVVKGHAVAQPMNFDNIHVTLDWRNTESSATLTGTMRFRDAAMDVSAWIAQPSALIRGDHSAATLRLHSAPIDLSANGDLASNDTTSFRGRIAINAPSIPDVFALGGYAHQLPAPFANLSLSSEATIEVDRDGHASGDLPNLKLRVDGNDYEGTLAALGGERPLLSGTLAANQLVLTPFLYRAPHLVDNERHWSRTQLPLGRLDGLGLDLRISASHLRLATLSIDDAALAIMTREGRTEIGLVEARAYGGTMRGRISFGTAAGGLNVRGVGSIADADAATLAWDVFGRQIGAGLFTGSANFETTGNSPATLVEHLQGSARGSATDGEIDGIDLPRSLDEMQARRFDGIVAALKSGRTPFTRASASVRLNDGMATIEDAGLQGVAASLSLSGKADLGERLFRLKAEALPTNASDEKKDKALPLRFNISGSFERAVVAPDFGALLGSKRRPDN